MRPRHSTLPTNGSALVRHYRDIIEAERIADEKHRAKTTRKLISRSKAVVLPGLTQDRFTLDRTTWTRVCAFFNAQIRGLHATEGKVR